MNCNVFIKHYSGGTLVGKRSIHNVWTRNGQQYLAQMVGALGFGGIPSSPSPSDPVFPERSDRLRYMGFGIGSNRQDNPLADLAPLLTSYPPGYAEERYPPDFSLSGYTNGKEYSQELPVAPLVNTLERPVRISGGILDYGSAPSTDTWRLGPPSLYFTHQSSQDVTVHAIVDASGSGHIAYSPFNLGVPLTEAGLFTDVVGATGTPYSPLVAYVSFDTIMIDENDTLEFIWQVKFG